MNLGWDVDEGIPGEVHTIPPDPYIHELFELCRCNPEIKVVGVHYFVINHAPLGE